MLESSGWLPWHHHKVAKVFCLSACCYGVCRLFWVVARALPKDFWLPACCYGVERVFWAVVRELPFSCQGLLPVSMLLWSCQGVLDGCQGISIQLPRSSACQHVFMELLGCSEGCQGITTQLLRSCGCQHVATEFLGCSGWLPGHCQINYGCQPVATELLGCSGWLPGHFQRTSGCQPVAMELLGCSGQMLRNYHRVAKVLWMSARFYGVLRGCQEITIQLLRTCGCQHVSMELLGCSGQLLGNYQTLSTVLQMSACCYGDARMFWEVARAFPYSC